MILIISSQNDTSTSRVIEWLLFNHTPFLRISENDKITIHKLNPSQPNDLQFIIRNRKYKLSDFNSIWYRRSWLKLEFELYYRNSNNNLNNAINRQLNEEQNVLFDYILKIFKEKSLNSEFDNKLNKIEVLGLCEKFGIKIPDTLLTTDKNTLIKFKKKHTSIISKNFTPGVFVKTESTYISPVTQIITDAMIESLSTKFYPMLFQETINKAFEVRSFYLDNKFYSIAIFSQNDEKTKVDFRNYNYEKPNRTPPFTLPMKIQDKLIKLMNHLGLKSGSIDLIVTWSGDFIFLEINPVGQFSQVSNPSNYNIERDISHFLTKNSYD